MNLLPVGLISGAPPVRATPGSAGYDLTCQGDVHLPPGGLAQVPTGLVLAIPDGWAGFVLSRSGLGGRKGVVVAQGVGLIDSDYRGEIIVPLRNTSTEPVDLRQGDRIAQIVFLPVPAVEFLPREADATRRSGGFGSTGA